MNAPATPEFLTLQEIVAAARSNLAPGPWSYLVGGAETETTVKRNRQALDSIALRPRVLRDVSRIDSSAKFFDHRVRLPVMLAPIGGLESIVDGGAAAAARASAQFGVPQMVSSVCQPGLEQTAAAAQNLRSFQLYVRGDDAWVDDFVRRAKDHGYGSFCLTVDVAVYSRRERDLVGRFVKPWRARAAEGKEFQAALSWDKVKRFKDKHDLPLIIKGIATVEDARLVIVDRDAARAAALAARLNEHLTGARASASTDLGAALSSASGLIHATNTGMAGTPGMPFPPALLRASMWVSEIVYVPLETELLKVARRAGCATADGGHMNVGQAIRGFKLFTGREADAARMDAYFRKLVS